MLLLFSLTHAEGRLDSKPVIPSEGWDFPFPGGSTLRPFRQHCQRQVPLADVCDSVKRVCSKPPPSRGEMQKIPHGNVWNSAAPVSGKKSAHSRNRAAETAFSPLGSHLYFAARIT